MDVKCTIRVKYRLTINHLYFFILIIGRIVLELFNHQASLFTRFTCFILATVMKVAPVRCEDVDAVIESVFMMELATVFPGVHCKCVLTVSLF